MANARLESLPTVTVGVGNESIIWVERDTGGGTFVSEKAAAGVAANPRSTLVADTSTASVGDYVKPDNSGGAITINLPTTGLFDGAEVTFEPLPPALYSVNPVTFDAGTNTVGPTYTTIEVTTDNLKGGFRWDASNNYWVGFKAATTGTEF